MSIDGTRKQTKGWEINSSGKMVNLSAGDGIVIDEAAPIAESATMPITDSAVVTTEPPAVLERPLEGAVESVDEAPPPSRWGRVGIFAVVVAVMGVGGGVVLSRQQTAVEWRAQASQPATSPGVAAPSVIAATATTPAPAAGAPAPADAANAGSATEDAAAAKSGHGKDSRSKSSKSSRHHSNKRAASSKHSSAPHH